MWQSRKTEQDGRCLGGDHGKLDARLALVIATDRIYQLRDGNGIGIGAPKFSLRRTVYLSLNQAF